MLQTRVSAPIKHGITPVSVAERVLFAAYVVEPVAPPNIDGNAASANFAVTVYLDKDVIRIAVTLLTTGQRTSIPRVLVRWFIVGP